MTPNLDGRWTLVDSSGDYSCDITLPGDGISALYKAGLIPNPYWGRNEYDLRWIADRDWTVSRTITVDDPAVELVLSGLDTVCTVRWNGTTVLETANSFRDYRISLNGIATKGENRVEITFHSATKAANALQDAHPFYLPYATNNSPVPNGNMLRKVGCDFGWDWNIALVPFGIYGDMRLESSQAVVIDRLAIEQSHSDGAVSVSVTAHLTRGSDQPFKITFADQTVEGTVNGSAVTAHFNIENPQLWWPVGLGEQPLYDLKVEGGGTTTTRRIGLRNMELITERDDIGLGFKFRVNGHDTFARGANWIPADALAGQITPEKTRALLQSAIDANMNMIRIWGGGRYEATWFYDLCDEMGLLVWQDFMFACNIFPSDPAYLAEVRGEVRDNVARMHHHACIALWCGDNELIGALSWFEETRANRDRYLVNYDRLNRCIEDTLKETDPTAIWWPSSPSPGPLDFGDTWHDDSSGDMHFWSVWHEGRDFDHYRDVSPRFCSEFGFQSYPSMSAIRKFAEPKDWNIASPIFESHQKNAGGNARIAETMFRYFRWPERFEDFVWLSQVQQGLAIKTAVTQWRGLKPHCMGTLIWQLNDTWPVCSWASLDHGGNWKLLHHMAKDFYAPVTVVCEPKDGTLLLRAINDARGDVDVSVTASAVNLAGELRTLGTGESTVGTDAQTVLRIVADTLADDDMLFFEWTNSDGTSGEDHFAPQPYKSYDLLPPNLDVRKDGNQLTISSDTLALFVSAEADIPGRFSDNAIMVRPGVPATLTFAPEDPTAAATFTLRDLHSATMARPA